MVRMRTLRFLTLVFAVSLFAGAAPNAYFVYVGTYTGHGSQGIYAYRFEPLGGKLTDIGLVARTENPSYLAVDPRGAHLYAANENNIATVSAFSIDRMTGKLVPLNQLSSRGASACALAVNHAGTLLFAANYRSGNVILFPIRPDGGLSEASYVDQHQGSSVNAQRQEKPHAHAAVFSPDDRFALSADLGVDQIYLYRVDPKRRILMPHGMAGVLPGAGPRHLTFTPDGKFVYVINELASTVTAFSWNAGVMKQIETVPALPKDYTGPKSGAEIQVHPDGRFLYASNRGEANDIAIFKIDPQTGRLTAAGHVPSGGRTPRNFAIDPTGWYLFAANQDSDNITLFRIDAKTGGLTPSGKTIAISAPVCVQFVPAE